MEAWFSRQCTLIVAENVAPVEGEILCQQRVNLVEMAGRFASLLRVAFGRWKVESVFRKRKEELGWDHFENVEAGAACIRHDGL